MKIKVGTFNLFQFVEPPFYCYTRKYKFTQQQWLEKTTWIKNQILKMDCDIIGFQEVFSSSALQDILINLGFKYFKIVDFPKLSSQEKYKYTSTTVALASKYPISSIEEVTTHGHSLKKHDFEGDFNFSRIPIKASVTLPNNTEILVYVCHFKSNKDNDFEYSSAQLVGFKWH